MNQNANITEQQYQKLIEYLDEARSKHMHLLYLAAGGSVLLAVPGLMLLSGISGNVYSDLAGIAWFLCLAATAVLFLTGYQKKFGSNAPLSQMKRRDYTCEYITVSTLSGSEGRPPYLVTDSLGSQYVCPVYLEFKQLRRGGSAISVFLPSGERMAVCDPAESDQIF